jgi:hypothetical protein
MILTGQQSRAVRGAPICARRMGSTARSPSPAPPPPTPPPHPPAAPGGGEDSGLLITLSASGGVVALAGVGIWLCIYCAGAGRNKKKGQDGPKTVQNDVIVNVDGSARESLLGRASVAPLRAPPASRRAAVGASPHTSLSFSLARAFEDT